MLKQLSCATWVLFLTASVLAGEKKEAKIEKIGTGLLKAPSSIRTAPSGDLVVLDRRGDASVVVTFSPQGKVVSEVKVPAAIPSPTVALADSAGNLYFSRMRDRSVWIRQANREAKPLDLKVPILGLAVQKVDGKEFLYVLGGRKDGVLRLPAGGGEPTRLTLSHYPDKGDLIELRVRPQGDLYGFSTIEHLIYHFDPRGQLKETFGGGGPAPPRTGLPADFAMSAYDVDDNGDVYWTMANYGPLLRYTADGNLGIHFRGAENWHTPWMGPIHTVVGLALSGSRAYAVDRGYNRVTSFPKSIVVPGASDTESIDTHIYGYSFRILSDTPYKLFTEPQARLRVAFDQGHRRSHKAVLAYVAHDLEKREVARGKVELEVPGDAAVERELPPIRLPRLGWYQLDMALMDGDKPLIERVAFLCRDVEDARLPIPAQEQTGWNDVATHKMIGMGLHRFGGDIKQILQDQQGAIEQARKLGVPYFVQITNERDCTPENVTSILKQYPDLPLLEIVNEPNLRMKVADYVQIVKRCREAARKVSPKVRIMGPSQCGTELRWFESFFKAGGGEYVDAVSVHTYERHNSMDPYHWNWKLTKLRSIMNEHGCKDKPLYQTEHGFLGDYHSLLLRAPWQGRSVFLEYLMMDRAGIGPARFYYYYVNQGGFRGFSAYLVSGARELFPAAALMRTRARLLGDRKLTKVLDFGEPGNWLVLGNRYGGSGDDLVVLVNCGVWKPVPVLVKLPGGSRVFDCFGNRLSLGEDKPVTIPVGPFPTYIQIPAGAKVEASLSPFGRNIAPESKITVSDAKAQELSGRLTNGRLEFDFENEPERVGLLASNDKLPLDVTLAFQGNRKIAAAVLYGSLADNDKCTPLEYEVRVRSGGVWKKVDAVRVEADGRQLKLGNFARLTWYDNPWIFVHRFEPVEADAVQFHFLRTTFGQYPTTELNAAITRSGLRPRVELREAQVFTEP